QENEQGGRVLRDGFSKRHDELVINTVVGERAGQGSGTCPYSAAKRHAGKWLEEHKPHQSTPDRTGKEPRSIAHGGQIIFLLEMNLALFIPHDNHRILKVDEIFFLKPIEIQKNSIRLSH